MVDAAPELQTRSAGNDAGTEDVPAGDCSSIDEVIRQYESSLLRYVTHLIGRYGDDAQDVVQEVFIRWCREVDRNGFDSIANVRCWLFRVAHNMAMDFGRKRSRQKRLRDEVMHDPGRGAAGHQDADNAAEYSARSEMRELAMHELDNLPESQKTVVLLKLIQGLTLREISEITGTKIGTVNYRITQGLRTLARRMKSFGAI